MHTTVVPIIGDPALCPNRQQLLRRFATTRSEQLLSNTERRRPFTPLDEYFDGLCKTILDPSFLHKWRPILRKRPHGRPRHALPQAATIMSTGLYHRPRAVFSNSNKYALETGMPSKAPNGKSSVDVFTTILSE